MILTRALSAVRKRLNEFRGQRRRHEPAIGTEAAALIDDLAALVRQATQAKPPR